MFHTRITILAFLIILPIGTSWVGAAELDDLSSAQIVIRSGDLPKAEKMAAQMLSEEIEKRTGLKIPVGTTWPKAPTPVIVIAARSGGPVADQELPLRTGKDLPEARPEGFAVNIQHNPHPVVWCIGADPRGALFGAGCVLRNLIWQKGSAKLPVDLAEYTAPTYAIRGHQLGYRPRANSWDAWTPEQFEQYIRDLAIFGTNAIENIPFQDSDPGPHMKVPRDVMNVKIGEICDKYDIEHWVWTPAEFPLDDQEKRAALLARHEAFYKSCPRLDGIFFPGGDPGDNPPELVLPFLKDVAALLAKYHPKAGVWLSLQGFDEEMTRHALDAIKKDQPTWLKGLVGGPSSPPLQMLRKELPPQYPIRDYPDITHTVRCQYPVPWFDPALGSTLGRECINPRPVFYARVIRYLLPYTCGFLSYSDGMHDDVNKVVWSALAWSPEKPVRDVLVDYGRFFFGPKVAEKSADAILALEENWNAALPDHGSIDATLAFWQELRKEAPENEANWRWCCLLYRADYDAFIRHRLIFENQLEKEACAALGEAGNIGSQAAMDLARKTLARVDTECPKQDLRTEIFELADRLFKQISLQSSVPKYQASGAERGASTDFVDRPVNNRWYLEDQFTEIAKLTSEQEKVARLKILAEWENPGSGSFYDDVGDPSKSDHVLRGEGLNIDPTMESNPPPTQLMWEGGMSRKRNSWPTYLDWPIGMRYEGLDPNGTYVVRMTGQGDAKLRIDGELVASTVYSKEIGGIKEFPVPSKALDDGLILLTWDKLNEAHLNWRQQSHLAELWVLKR